ncbi:Small GTPase superfamily ARF/SAR type [Penicillium lagena]|uniref:Small GTPase superfamily ARF/SAR type n=1 Tax=Penicillium lagena TaxID=94218 RepID=UPI0025422B6E|nr:Small GTPase superfamily ARF/SAR type [Penicillium lagena]KAJ5624982.1 Small GTPase superfamily ARF/SAR type [Penicillium lagena]
MLSILRKARLKDKEMRILMLYIPLGFLSQHILIASGSGLDNAGKTTIVKRIMNEDITTVSPTLGFIIKTIDFNGYKLNIWDVGGQRTLRSYWKNYFEKTDTLIWVVDATDRLRVEDCRQELTGLLLEEVGEHPISLLQSRNIHTDAAGYLQRLMGASLMVFLNKTDVEECMTEEEVRERLGLDSIKTHKWTILPCSAMTGKNLKEGLSWVVQDAKDRLFLY